jgi:hypothetical protein
MRGLKKEPTQRDIIQLVSVTLSQIAPYGVTAEVIASALMALKQNAQLTIRDAILQARKEWDVL